MLTLLKPYGIVLNFAVEVTTSIACCCFQSIFYFNIEMWFYARSLSVTRVIICWFFGEVVEKWDF